MYVELILKLILLRSLKGGNFMKKLLIALALALSVSVPSFAANWYWIGGSPSGDQCFIDNSSVIKEESLYAPGTALLWIKINHTDGSHTLERIKISQTSKDSNTILC